LSRRKWIRVRGKQPLLLALHYLAEDFDRAKWLVVETVCGGLQNVERG